MRYQISGKQIDVGQALQTHVENELNSIVEKYAERPTDAHVIFSKSASEFVCEATVHLSTGLTAQAKAHAHEIYAAFDDCSEKLEKQLRRYKRRLKDHHRDRAEPIELSQASAYILASEADGENRNPKACSRLSLQRWSIIFPLCRSARRSCRWNLPAPRCSCSGMKEKMGSTSFIAAMTAISDGSTRKRSS